MPHLNTGDYVVKYYNSYGSKLVELTEQVDNYLLAEKIGNRTLQETQRTGKYKPVSFTVDRRIHNSLDSN